jgi:hypothetical protein
MIATTIMSKDGYKVLKLNRKQAIREKCLNCRGWYPEDVVQVHGWGDPLVTALAASVGLYETLFDTMGVEKTKSFYKLYLVPGGYDIRDWHINKVVCEGASAVSGTIAGNTYIAKFNRQDLTGVSPGAAATLEVTLDFLHNGVLALTQGYGTVQVIK